MQNINQSSRPINPQMLHSYDSLRNIDTSRSKKFPQISKIPQSNLSISSKHAQSVSVDRAHTARTPCAHREHSPRRTHICNPQTATLGVQFFFDRRRRHSKPRAHAKYAQRTCRNYIPSKRLCLKKWCLLRAGRCWRHAHLELSVCCAQLFGSMDDSIYEPGYIFDVLEIQSSQLARLRSVWGGTLHCHRLQRRSSPNPMNLYSKDSIIGSSSLGAHSMEFKKMGVLVGANGIRYVCFFYP